MHRLAEHGSCFVCGRSNPHGLGVTWWADREAPRRVWTRVTLNEAQQGPPRHVHGGASAALLDEAMGAAVWHAGNKVVAAKLEVEYRRALPLGVELYAWGELVEKHGRTLTTRGAIELPDGTVAVIGRGAYVEAPQFFSDLAFFETRDGLPDADPH